MMVIMPIVMAMHIAEGMMAMIDDDHRTMVTVMMIEILGLGQGCGRGQAAQRDKRCCKDFHGCLLGRRTNRRLN
jgi:hypothetical protein